MDHTEAETAAGLRRRVCYSAPRQCGVESLKLFLGGKVSVAKEVSKYGAFSFFSLFLLSPPPSLD